MRIRNFIISCVRTCAPFPGVACIVLLFAAPSFAQDAAPLAALRAALDRELGASRFPRATTAAAVIRLDNGAFLYERNADLLLRPASTAKLFTTYAALRVLDSAEAFATELYARHAEGTGTWDLFLRGGGDPLFGIKDIQKLVENISVKGVREIASLTLDASQFDTLWFGKGWMIDDEPEAFQPCLSPFPIEHDMVHVSAHADKAGVSVRMDPAWEMFECANSARPGIKDSLVFTKIPRSNRFIVAGTLKQGEGDSAEMSIWDPARIVHARFLQVCRESGIRVRDEACRFGAVPEKAERFGFLRRPLDEVLAYMNPESDNLSAESLLKRMAHRRTGRPGSSEAGIRIMRDELEAAGIDTTALQLVDGSGISFYNLCSARIMGSTLSSVWHSRYRERFVRSLAVPGKKGTLKRRMEGIEGREYIHAKTGTLRGVSNLAGFALPPGGVPVGFAIFVQNVPEGPGSCRTAQDAVVEAILRYCRKAAGATRPGAIRSGATRSR